MKKLRLAVSGFPGTGKTTLCNALAQQYDLPVIAEDMMQIANRNADYLRLRMDPGTPAEALLEAKKQSVKSFFDWAQDREKKYAEHEGFIADRWELDLLNWWVVQFGKGSHSVDEFTLAMHRNFRKKSKLFDYLVLTPLEQPFERHRSTNDQGVRRKIDMTSHLLFTVVSSGLVKEFTNIRTIQIPRGSLSTEQRLAFLDKEIHNTAGVQT